MDSGQLLVANAEDAADDRCCEADHCGRPVAPKPDKCRNSNQCGDDCGPTSACCTDCYGDFSEEATREVFDTFDISGDGLISFYEMKNAIRSIAPDMKSRCIKSLFKQVDQDCNGTIAYREFHMMLNLVGRDVLGSSSSLIFSVTRAAHHILEAFSGTERSAVLNTAAARRYSKMKIRLYPIRWVCALLLILGTFFEMPSWCLNQTINEGNPECHQTTDIYPSFDLPMLKPSEMAIVNVPCILVFVADMVLIGLSCGWSALLSDISVSSSLQRTHMSPLKAKIQGRYNFRFPRTEIVLILLLVLNGAYMLVAEMSSSVAGFSLEPIIRLLYFVMMSPELSLTFVQVASILPKFMTIAVLLLIFLSSYAGMGCLLYEGTPEGDAIFPTFGDALWNLLILLTTANNPDVMMKAYNAHRVAALYFVPFLLIGFFFLLNFVLALVSNLYMDKAQEQKDALGEFKSQKLTAAFHMLRSKNKPFITEATTIALFKELQSFKTSQPLSSEMSDLMFAILDTDGDRHIQEDEFLKMCLLMLLHFERIEVPFLERKLPCLRQFRVWRYLTAPKKSRWVYKLNLMVDVLLSASFLFVIVHYSGRKDYGDETAAVAAVGSIVLLLLLMAQLIKVSTRGWVSFWRRGLNRFDLIMNLLAVVVFVLTLSSMQLSQRYLIVVLLVQLARLMRHVPAWRLLIEVIMAGQRPALRLVAVLLAIMFFFGSIGIQLFGGRVTLDTTSEDYKRLLQTDFGQSDYWANNFNDMPSAMMTLFALVVVNNWFEIVDGMVAVTSSWARIYFIAFWVIGVVFFFNLVIGFVLDIFHQEYVAERSDMEIPGASIQMKDGNPVGIFEVETLFSPTSDAHDDLLTSPLSPGALETPVGPDSPDSSGLLHTSTNDQGSAIWAPPGKQLSPVSPVTIDRLRRQTYNGKQLNHQGKYRANFKTSKRGSNKEAQSAFVDLFKRRSHEQSPDEAQLGRVSTAPF